MIDTIFLNWSEIIGTDTINLLLTGFIIFAFLFTFIDFWKQ